MKMRFVFLVVIATLAVGGCVKVENDSNIIAEGTIYYVEYQMSDGRTGGFTRVNHSAMVPGGNGSWNVAAYGRLTRDFLIITYPQKNDLGPRVIPTHRLLDIQFGDGGVRQIDEKNRPAGSL